MRRPFLLLSLAGCVVCCSHGSAISDVGRGGPVETQNSVAKPEALTPPARRNCVAFWRVAGCLSCNGPISLRKVRR
jgi:hypothetical protein